MTNRIIFSKACQSAKVGQSIYQSGIILLGRDYLTRAGLSNSGGIIVFRLGYITWAGFSYSAGLSYAATLSYSAYLIWPGLSNSGGIVSLGIILFGNQYYLFFFILWWTALVSALIKSCQL